MGAYWRGLGSDARGYVQQVHHRASRRVEFIMMGSRELLVVTTCQFRCTQVHFWGESKWLHSKYEEEPLTVVTEDWTFAHLRRVETLWGPHGYHRYPAKFIPQLVSRLIERYSLRGELVGDPFLGKARVRRPSRTRDVKHSPQVLKGMTFIEPSCIGRE